MELDAEVKEAILQAIQSREAIFFSCDALEVSFQSIALSFSKNHIVLKNVVPLNLIQAFTAAKSYQLQISMAKFISQSISSDGKDIIFPLAKGAKIAEVRKEKRVPISCSDVVECEFINPIDDLTTLKKRVLEMSESGMSVALPYDSKLFSPNVSLGAVKILRNRKVYKQVKATVVYKRQLISERGDRIFQAGIRFD